MSENHIYYCNRANAYLEIGEDNKCIDDCKRSIEIDKTFVKAYYRWALALVALERQVEAIKVLEDGMTIDE